MRREEKQLRAAHMFYMWEGQIVYFFDIEKRGETWYALLSPCEINPACIKAGRSTFAESYYLPHESPNWERYPETGRLWAVPWKEWKGECLCTECLDCRYFHAAHSPILEGRLDKICADVPADFRYAFCELRRDAWIRGSRPLFVRCPFRLTALCLPSQALSRREQMEYDAACRRLFVLCGEEAQPVAGRAHGRFQNGCFCLLPEELAILHALVPGEQTILTYPRGAVQGALWMEDAEDGGIAWRMTLAELTPEQYYMLFYRGEERFLFAEDGSWGITWTPDDRQYWLIAEETLLFRYIARRKEILGSGTIPEFI